MLGKGQEDVQMGQPASLPLFLMIPCTAASMPFWICRKLRFILAPFCTLFNASSARLIQDMFVVCPGRLYAPANRLVILQYRTFDMQIRCCPKHRPVAT